MLAMRIRLTANLSFGATCGPVEALRGDFDHCAIVPSKPTFPPGDSTVIRRR